MHDLTKKDAPWKWGEAENGAFEKLKKSFTEAPVLALADNNAPLRVEADSSDFATGAVLSMQKGDKWHPVAFLSHGLSGPERNYPIYDKEMPAIILVL